MLCRNFELILIKIGFFYEFLKLLKNLTKYLYSIKHMVMGQISSNKITTFSWAMITIKYWYMYMYKPHVKSLARVPVSTTS